MSADGGREFDWLDADVIVPQQPAIAVYLNPTGDVVLRQRGDLYDDDSWCWFRIERAPAVARAIIETAGLDIAELMPEPTRIGSKPKDPSAAERQRRYRERQKKESTPEPDIFGRDVTARDVTDDRDRDVPCNGNAA